MFGTLGMAASPLVAGLVKWLSGPSMVFVVLGVLNLAGVLLMPALAFKEGHGAIAKSSPQRNARLAPFLFLLLANMLGGIVFSGATVVLTAYLETRSHGILSLLTGTWGLDVPSNLLATAVAASGYMIGMLGQYAERAQANAMTHDTRILLSTRYACRWPSQWPLLTIFRLLVSRMPISFFSWGCSRVRIPLLLGLVPSGCIIPRMV